jgi:uncharacterized membrane protein YgaE (UPF0421/DUF939 family)
MRQVVTGWLLVAGCLVVLGVGAFIGAQTTRGATVPAATIQQWRQYATEVERGTRTPSAVTTRMLTETAIAQHEYATAAEQLLRFVGAGVALLGLILLVDLARYRARQARVPPGGA